MTDDVPFYAPDRKPTPPRQPQPGEILWTLHQGGHTRQAQLRDRGEWGVEFQLFANGNMLYGQLCATRGLAEMVATQERRGLAQQGWTT